MHEKFHHWIRPFLLIGLLASMLTAMPVHAGGIQSTPNRDAKLFVAPARPILVSPPKGTLFKTTNVTLKWKDGGVDRYHVQIAYDKTFLDLIISDDNVLGVTLGTVLPPGKLYYWRVKAINGSGEESPWSSIWNFKTPLLRPTLVSPTNGEALFVDRPTFTWNVATNASKFIVQVSALNDFSTLLLNKTVNAPDPESGITIVEYSMTTDLPQKKTLYWRVRGINSLLTGPWSVKWSFKTGNPPSVPVLVSPANAALVKDFTPLFNWNNSTIPTGVTFKQYDIQVDNDKDFSSPEIEDTNTVSDFTGLADLTPQTTYYWRVRAVGTVSGVDHTSSWSTRWSFITSISAPTSLTMILGDPNPLRPSFDWDDSAATGVTGYTIQISTKTDFSTLIVNSTTPNSSYAMTKDLPANKTIYWRVRVNGTNGPSAWTTTEFLITVP